MASAASRVPAPKIRRTGHINSTAPDNKAATSGDKKGTLYSYLKRAILFSQFEILTRPERKKIDASQ